MKYDTITIAVLLSFAFIFYSCSSSETWKQNSTQNNPVYSNGCVNSSFMLMGWCPVPKYYSIENINVRSQTDSNKMIIHFPYYLGENDSNLDKIVELADSGVQLFAIPDETIPMANFSVNNLSNNSAWFIKGIKVLLVNSSSETLKQTLQDESLREIQEAKDKNGEWQPIEYWANSTCGNSYFSYLMLPPGTYVAFGVYRYAGEFKTKLRCKLSLTKGMVRQTIISNEFEGSINTEQFKKREEVSPWIEYF